MSDLIDRQALKQALGINADDCDKCAWGSYGRCKRGSDFEDACCAIDDAPSAEQDVPDTNVGDMISRQDAIDVVANWFKKIELNGDICLDGLRSLPSAKKTGKWLVRIRHEHYPSGKEYQETVCSLCGRTDHNGDGSYCGYCGAKMEVQDD